MGTTYEGIYLLSTTQLGQVLCSHKGVPLPSKLNSQSFPSEFFFLWAVDFSPCLALHVRPWVAWRSFFCRAYALRGQWSAIERPATGICNREAHISCRLWLARTDSPRDRDSSRPITSTLTRHTRWCRPSFVERLRCWDGGTHLVTAPISSVRLRADRKLSPYSSPLKRTPRMRRATPTHHTAASLHTRRANEQINFMKTNRMLARGPR